MEEIWKNIENCNYAVSNLGNIKRLGYTITFDCGYILQEPEKLIKLQLSSGGYCRVFLKNFNGGGYYPIDNVACSVHRFVAKAFIPNPENKPLVNHINGIKHDNRVENLEWCTQKENIRHAVKTGLMTYKYGFKNPKTILKPEYLEEINSLILKGFSYNEIEEKFNFRKGYLSIKRNSKRRVSNDITKELLPDYRNKNYSYATQEFVDLLNFYIKEGKRDFEIVEILNLPTSFLSEARRMKKFNEFNILPGNKHRKISPELFKQIDLEIKEGLTLKEFEDKYNFEESTYYKIRRGVYYKNKKNIPNKKRYI